VPGARACPLAGRPSRGTARRALFPCGVHGARAGCGDRVPEPGRGVRHPVPRRLGDATQNRRRPPASGGRDRLPGRAAHLGTEPVAPSAPALPGARWRDCTRWPALDFRPSRVLPSGQGAVAEVPRFVLEKAFTAGELRFFSAHRHLQELAAFRRYLAPVRDTEWIVYAKRPFAGPAQVLEYVGRYTHRVAISNNRLVSMGDGKVCFRWKDHRAATGKGR
jgi:Putative transposase